MKSWSADPESELSFPEVFQETSLYGLNSPVVSLSPLKTASDLQLTWQPLRHMKVECDLDVTRIPL